MEEKLAREAEVNCPALEKERSELTSQGRRLGEAIATLGLSAFVAEQLRSVESRLAEIDRLLTSKPAAKLPTFTDEQIWRVPAKECKDFCELGYGHLEVAKREIQKRIKRLVLTPRQTPNGTVFEITGDVELFQHEDAMLNNSMEGIGQHCALLSDWSLADVMLDPSLPVAA